MVRGISKTREAGWHSVKKEGYPPEGQDCLVTVLYNHGLPCVEDGYVFVRDVSSLVDLRTKNGQKFVKDHPNGIWQQYHSDGFYGNMIESDLFRVIAWFPYPEPYFGE